jgi:hypothetical protein
MASNDWDRVFAWAEGNFVDLSFVVRGVVRGAIREGKISGDGDQSKPTTKPSAKSNMDKDQKELFKSMTTNGKANHQSVLEKKTGPEEGC